MVGPPRFELGSNAPEAPSIGQANPRALGSPGTEFGHKVNAYIATDSGSVPRACRSAWKIASFATRRPRVQIPSRPPEAEMMS